MMSARSIPRWAGRAALLRSTATALCLSTAACGGGGGGVNSTPAPPVVTTPDPIVTPVPTPTPTPTPAPTPSPTSTYDTAEYRATVGAVSMNALAAYQRNATGAGIAVGIVDTGIDAGTEEFPGRVSTASANVAGGTSTDDVDGHGTAVAFTIAGRRNGAGTHGVAFDATVIVARADQPGSCTATGEDEGCSFVDPAIARGINLATSNGARVINLSLGGSAPSADVVAAINRATAAGIIVVISAGNDFDDNPTVAVNPDTFAQIANNDAASRGLVIIAGSVNASDQISAFSNRAGNSAAHYLTAVGERVRAPCDNTSVCLWSGTSFSAPQISAAVALLAQAFPNLTGAQIVSILYASARDAGTAGTDATYGRGILDLTRAFQPLGTSSVAGGQGVLSFTSNAMLSAPMGDAAQGPLGAVILDGYSRAFAMDLARTINRDAPVRGFVASLQPTMRGFSSSIDGSTTVAVTLAVTSRGIAVERTLLSPDDARTARAIAGTVTRRMGSNAAFAFGFAQGAGTLTAQLAGRRDPAFLVARDATTGQGFDSRVRGSGAYRQQFGAWGVTAGMESGDVLSGARTSGLPVIRYRFDRSAYTRTSIALDRGFGGLRLGLSASRLDEGDTLLGARFGAGLGATRGTSWFLDTIAEQELGRGWSLRASMRQGWTLADVRAGLGGGGTIRTNGFAADLAKHGVFGRRDGLGFRISQPLRVAAGGIDLNLPVGYDYASGRPNDWLSQRLNLAPTGREIDLEARYVAQLLGGDVQANLFWRRDPGNISALPDDRGAALRYTLAF